jgi:hypothetical protein
LNSFETGTVRASTQLSRPERRFDMETGGRIMTPESALINARPSPDFNEIRPVFVNDEFNSADELGDWWLDLGLIDLPA